MATSSGIWNHAVAAQTAVKANPMDTTSGSSGSSTDSSTISANDFLSLLVTEMQNQDPTADTDPMEYVNQLVNVNSLEQLISINQTLTTDSSGTASTSSTPGASSPTGAAAKSGNQKSDVAHIADAAATASQFTTSGEGDHKPTARVANGNLSVPETSAAAQRVAQSLSGRASSL